MSRVSGKSYFVYILWSESACRFYIGISENVNHRVTQHNQGLSRWTARHKPWMLVYQEAQPNYRSARLRENQLKRQKCGDGFFRLTGLDRQKFHKHPPQPDS